MTTPPSSNPEIRAALRDGFSALASGNHDQAAKVGSQHGILRNLVFGICQVSLNYHVQILNKLRRYWSEHLPLIRATLRIIWIMRAVVWPRDRATTL